MDRRILFIREYDSFLLNAMTGTLTEHGFVVVDAAPTVASLNAIDDLPDIFIVYLNGDVNNFKSTLSYLRKLLIAPDRKRALFLMGTQNELNVAWLTVPQTLVTGSFITPVNMKDVVERLNRLLMNDSGGGRKRILVVDDDSVSLRAMRNLLSRHYDVSMVTSGMNAIQFLSTNEVNLILLDYEMPVVSGLQVFEMLKSEPLTAGIPVIFLTAKDDRDTVMKVLAVKPVKYLLKTMPPEQLLQNIDDFFAGA